MAENDQRLVQLQRWIAKQFPAGDAILSPLKGDASFRRYFRVHVPGRPALVAMDAPPERESCDAFVAVAKAFKKLSIDVPEIYASEIEQGFLLLSDLGDKLYLDELTADSADELYRTAIDALLKIQTCTEVANYSLPIFDENKIFTELFLFRDWFLKEQLQIDLSIAQEQLLNDCFQLLSSEIVSQPRVCVHRDYHSRNLLVLDGGGVGVLDFQDAVLGPVSYDLVSLLKDCYITWPAVRVKSWVNYYVEQASELGILNRVSPQQFMQWFNWVGIQRHMKAIGIFARLNKLYGKPGYLADIPRTLDYIIAALAHYPHLMGFSRFLIEDVQPLLKEKVLTT